MQPIKRTAYPAWVYGPLGGASLAVGLAFTYAAVFILYATVRSSLLVLGVNPEAGVPGTIVAYFFALAVPALVIAAMMAIPAALIGLVTAPILKRVILFLNPQHSQARAIAAGSATCFGISVIALVALQRMLGFTVTNVAANPETFLLWFALPAMIFIGAGGAAGREINRVTSEALRRKEQNQVAKTEGTNLSVA